MRFKSQLGEQVEAEKVVDLVGREAMSIRKQNAHLNNEQVAILVSLKIAAEKLSIENDYKDNVEKLKTTALDALQLIEDVSPPTN